MSHLFPTLSCCSGSLHDKTYAEGKAGGSSNTHKSESVTIVINMLYTMHKFFLSLPHAVNAVSSVSMYVGDSCRKKNPSVC